MVALSSSTPSESTGKSPERQNEMLPRSEE
jgi:hypothetical protein